MATSHATLKALLGITLTAGLLTVVTRGYLNRVEAHMPKIEPCYQSSHIERPRSQLLSQILADQARTNHITSVPNAPNQDHSF
jgi:hypothetical protein